jgi:hypothetical protein
MGFYFYEFSNYEFLTTNFSELRELHEFLTTNFSELRELHEFFNH